MAGSEKETCERAEIGRSTYYSYLNGENLPSRENLERVVKAWGGNVPEWLERRRRTEMALAQLPSPEKVLADLAEEPQGTTALYTIMVLAISRFADHNDFGQHELRQRFHKVWMNAQQRSDLEREIKSADRGDSWMFWEPGIELVSEAAYRLLPSMAELINYDNHDKGSSDPLRIRGALHVTEARENAVELFGSNVNEVYRFADAPILREELASSEAGDLAVIFSDHARRVGNLIPRQGTMHGIHVDGWKEWGGGTAWLYTPRPNT